LIQSFNLLFFFPNHLFEVEYFQVEGVFLNFVFFEELDGFRELVDLGR
jgi:hypothetical protein